MLSKMSNGGILVVGSVALDSVETPFGARDNALGGSATYFSISAGFFNRVNIVATVGTDFPRRSMDLLRKRGIGLDGLTVDNGKTFRWKGRYRPDLNTVDTIYTHLNVFKTFDPRIPHELRSLRYVFLANIDPVLQAKVLASVRKPALVACDTMNYWIQSRKKELVALLKKVDMLLLNDSEARELSQDANLIRAARWIISRGPGIVVIKKGEHGALCVSRNSCFAAPAFPLTTLRDPTGAGDSFAGGMIGYLSRVKKHDDATIRKAIIYGSVMGSYCVEDFGVNRLLRLTPNEIQKRFQELRRLTSF